MKKICSLVLVLILSAGMFAGCSNKTGTSADSNSAKTQKPVVILSSMAGKTLDILAPNATSDVDILVMNQIFDSLTRIDENGNAVPWLATEWKVADDGLTYTVKLRNDVSFQDGSKFTASDIKYFFDKTMADKVNSVLLTRNFKSCDVVDDYTLKFVAVSYATNLGNALNLVFAIPKTAREKDVTAFGQSPVGSGPYKFVSQGVDGTVKLAANENYFNGAPKIKEVIVRPYMDAVTAIVGLQSKDIDIAFNMPTAQLDVLKTDKEVTVETGNKIGTTHSIYLGSNLKDDINLKKAIYHAINRQNAVLLAENGQGKVASDLFNDFTLGKYKGAVKFDEYDVNLAKQYLAKSSYDKSKPLTFTISEDNSDLAQSLQADLAAIGLKLNIENLDPTAWTTKFLSGKWQMTVSGFAPGISVNIVSSFESINYIAPAIGVTKELTDKIGKVRQLRLGEEFDKTILSVLQDIHDSASIIPVYMSFSNTVYNTRIASVGPCVSEAYYLLHMDQVKLAEK